MTDLPFPVHPDAPCLSGDAERFFDPARAADAKDECRRCPSRYPCLDYALENLVDGIWSATDEGQRRRLRAKLGIVARPLSFGRGTCGWGPALHGTAAAYQAHRRRGEKACGPCTEGQRRYQEGWRAS